MKRVLTVVDYAAMVMAFIALLACFVSSIGAVAQNLWHIAKDFWLHDRVAAVIFLSSFGWCALRWKELNRRPN
jgi:hypothetical protein